jgi:putative membrane-bound dehydrogenase-like protein
VRAYRLWLISIGIVATAVASLILVAQGLDARSEQANASASAPGKPIKVLIVGLSPAQTNLYPLLASPLARRGIQLTVTNGDAATAERLPFYDVLMLPGKEGERTPEQEQAIKAFKGPVFYASADSDAGTWSSSAFRTRIEEGIVAAVAEPARTAWKQLKMADTVYVDGLPIPNYENRDPAPRYQLPLSVQESMKYIQVPAEFSVELFASEPDIVKPISFNFDERGRLWMIETVDYPNKILNGQPGDDRIKILEDTNGDGRADKITTFADRLNIPTSLTFANGGVIVSQAPHILFLKDTNGDDKADVREVLSTGWGIGDTHAGPSNLQYGPDNYVWGSVGYSGFKGTMNGKPMQFSQGLFRFRPDGSGFEFVTASTNNTWGLGFTETFDVFGSTANNEPSFYAAIPNRYFDGVDGLPASRGGGPGYLSIAAFYPVHPLTPYIRQVDVHGGYTAAAGHNIYTARAFPKEYWNRIAFIAEPTAHLVGQGVLEKQGAGFVTRDGWNLFAGSEEWVAPIHAQVGPDGAVWVSDWYNFITQHNPTPPGFSNGPGNAFETSLRDRQRGRIYRVAYKNAPPLKRRSLSRNDPAGLIEALSADNMFWRLHAQRLIVERGQKDIVPQLLTLARSKTVDAVGISAGAFHALWVLKGLGQLDAPGSEAYRTAVDALKHPAAGVRKAAVLVLPKDAATAGAVLAARLLADPDLHTRLAATLAVAELPTSAEIGAELYKESQNPENFRDRWLSRAFYIAASRHKAAFLTSYKSDAHAVAFKDLPLPLRLGATKPDWRVPVSEELTEWRDMEVPGNWESRGLPDFDGVVWFTRNVDWPQGARASGLTIGRIANTSEVWVNGLLLTPQPGGGRGGAPAASGRGFVPPTYDVPSGTLRSGQNTISVRIQNTRSDGGFIGTPDSMFIEAGEKRIPLAGTWKYRVERQTNAGALYSKPGELAAHLAYTDSGGSASAQLPPPATQAPDVTLKLGVVPGQLKFDLEELTVAPGQLVEIVFVNSDQMQHNFLLGAPGSLEVIGKAADELATSPNAAAQQYVPEISQVLFSTKLVDPDQTLRFQFKAPAQAGQYPYVCTFPGHWRLMNGVLRVVAPKAH